MYKIGGNIIEELPSVAVLKKDFKDCGLNFIRKPTIIDKPNFYIYNKDKTERLRAYMWRGSMEYKVQYGKMEKSHWGKDEFIYKKETTDIETIRKFILENSKN